MLIKDKKLNLVNIMLIIYTFSIIFFADGDTALKVIKVIFVGVSALHIILKHKIHIDKYVFWMIAFTFFCALSVNWAISKQDARSIVSTLILNNICIFFIINLLYEDKNRMDLIVNTIIFTSIVSGLQILIRYGFFVFINGNRSISGVVSANLIGMVAAIASALAVYKFREQEKSKKLYIVAFALNIIIMILSASRKAIFFFLIPIIIYYILKSKNVLGSVKKLTISFFICALFFVMIMKIPFLYNSVGCRIETMMNGLLGEGETDSSTSFRMTMIEWGIDWFKIKPYWGYGINNYKDLLGTKRTFFGAEGVYAHNNYVELLVDVGIVGTLLYYSIYVAIIFKVIKRIKKLSTFQMVMFGILIACIINEYGMVTYYAKFNQLILALVWIALYNKKEEIS